MRWSLKLGRFAGTAVYLHWTFALLMAWVFFALLGTGQSIGQALAGVGFILVLFLCVLLHEFGHVLAAKHYGVSTRDITLLPIGGLARLERIPEKPAQELWVALAGPAVNAAIAAAIFLLLLGMGRAGGLPPAGWFEGGFLTRLMWVNLLIVAFNLLPAFPMDGGRVLRALLAARMGRRPATTIAANIGQGTAVLFGIAGVLFNPFLIFIALFVYLGAKAEAVHVETESALEGLKVRDAMMTRFRSFSTKDPLEDAVDELLAGSQQDFPVVEDKRIVGILRHKDIVRALSGDHRDDSVGSAMSRDCEPVSEDDSLRRTLQAMRTGRCSAVPVSDGDRLTGVLTLESISELLTIKEAMHGDGDPPRARVPSREEISHNAP